MARSRRKRRQPWPSGRRGFEHNHLRPESAHLSRGLAPANSSVRSTDGAGGPSIRLSHIPALREAAAPNERPKFARAIDQRLAAFGAGLAGRRRVRSPGYFGSRSWSLFSPCPTAPRTAFAFSAPPFVRRRCVLATPAWNRRIRQADFRLAGHGRLRPRHERRQRRPHGRHYRRPLRFAVGDVVELILQARREADLKHAWEVFDEKIAHHTPQLC